MNEFDVENILTCSAGDYAASMGVELSDYKMVGVHSHAYNSSLSWTGFENKIKTFISALPEGTEVVVNYAVDTTSYYNGSSDRTVYSGTALIPKEKS